MSDARPILYVVTLFPCWSETFIVREIEALLRHGESVRIVSLKDAHEALVHPSAAALADRVRYARGGPAGVWNVVRECIRRPLIVGNAVWVATTSLWRDPAALMKTLASFWRVLTLAPWVRREAPSHIHAHWATYASSAAWLLARLCDVPFSFTSHAHDLFLFDQFIARKISDARFAVTISQYNHRLIAERYGEQIAARVHVVHCGVDLRDSADAPADVAESRDAARLLAIGRLDPIKGFDTLIRACALLRDAGRSFVCDIIGEGPQRAALEALIGSHRLDDAIRLRGAQPQREVRDAIRHADLFLMPSVVAPNGDQDGIPVALMEAMAGRLPVISTTVSGIPELVENRISGVLVPPGDARALSEAIIDLMDHEPLRRSMGAHARQRVVRDFNADREGGKIAALIRSHAA